jgi:hypothetical protein
MQMIEMTCENHPDLLWHCKEIAVSPSRRYNGARNIFFAGKVMPDGSISEFDRESHTFTRECACPGSALIKVEKSS